MFRSFSPGFFGFFCFFQSFVLVFGFFSPCLNKASQGFGGWGAPNLPISNLWSI